MTEKVKIPNWEEKTYGGWDGKITVGWNDVKGWEHGKAQGGEHQGLCVSFRHQDDGYGATTVSLEEAKDLYQALGQYINFMECEAND